MLGLSTLDLVLALLLLLVALSGWRQGLVRGLLSLCGFVIGGFLAIQFAPQVLGWLGIPAFFRASASLTVVLIGASLGNTAAQFLGNAARRTISFSPLRLIDSAAGSIFNVVAVSLIVWIIATALVTNTGAWQRQVNNSQVIATIDSYAPQTARSWLNRMQSWIDTSGLPRVVGGIGLLPAPPVAPADPQISASAAIKAAATSVVRIEGRADGCSGTIVGTGFVFATERVMTNAHVVAGVTNPTVGVPGGKVYRGSVVAFDPETDIAVLDVPGLQIRTLPFGTQLGPRDEAVALGYAGGGPLVAAPARVRSVVDAVGTNIYGGGAVERRIVTLRAKIERGDSGGPLLNPSGEVVGVIFAKSVDDPDTGYALALNEFLDDAQRGIRSTTPVAVGKCAASD